MSPGLHVNPMAQPSDATLAHEPVYRVQRVLLPLVPFLVLKHEHAVLPDGIASDPA